MVLGGRLLKMVGSVGVVTLAGLAIALRLAFGLAGSFRLAFVGPLWCLPAALKLTSEDNRWNRPVLRKLQLRRLLDRSKCNDWFDPIKIMICCSEALHAVLAENEVLEVAGQPPPQQPLAFAVGKVGRGCKVSGSTDSSWVGTSDSARASAQASFAPLTG